MPYLDNWDDKYAKPRSRRLLALDGGGIRGIISLEILRKIEIQLATATGADKAIDPDDVKAMDAVANIGKMKDVGQAYASKFVEMAAFKRFQ